MSTEKVAREPNLWEGILFFPDAAPESRFMATIVDGSKTRTVGLFGSLESAVAARDHYIEHHTLRTRETATYQEHYETRPINA